MQAAVLRLLLSFLNAKYHYFTAIFFLLQYISKDTKLQNANEFLVPMN